MVLAVDEGIGEIVSLLKEKDLFDETIILFSTDNGGAPSVGGFNYPYRGQKATVYQVNFYSFGERGEKRKLFHTPKKRQGFEEREIVKYGFLIGRD